METVDTVGTVDAAAVLGTTVAEDARGGLRLRGPGGSYRLTAPVVVHIWDGRCAEQHEVSYDTVAGGRASARVTPRPGCVVTVEDVWSRAGDAARVTRTVRVDGEAPGLGFATELAVDVPVSTWDDAQVFLPGTLYGDPDRVTAAAIGGRGSVTNGVREMLVREDRLPAPLVAVRFPDGRSVALLDPRPDGATTEADAATAAPFDPLVDAGFRVGALGLSLPAEPGEPARLSYAFPGSEGEVTYRGDTYPYGQLRAWRRRYHPLVDGARQDYVLELRAAAAPDLSGLIRESWRWAYDRLAPRAPTLDVAAARTALFDQLAGQAVVNGNLAGWPIFREAVDGLPPTDRGYEQHALMGFCGRSTDCAWHLLREAERVDPVRAERFGDLGRRVLDAFTTRIPVDPPAAEGFDLVDGSLQCSTYIGLPGVVHLRALAEGGRSAIRAWQHEHSRGRERPAWRDWAVALADWLCRQQHADGGLPRAWVAGTTEIASPSTASTYQAVAFLVAVHRATGDPRYLDAARAAGAHAWDRGHVTGAFVGGTLDNPDVVDKEAGTLSLEAYLDLFEATGDRVWLDRARAAADFAETWIYLWDVPMPPGEEPDRGWKTGVSTVGLQLIATGHSLVDAYMAFDVGNYARLAVLTGEDHYLAVARLLLHGTKGMLALPGREYDLRGPGWQQEHWSLAPRRGHGLHRHWLPWVTCSHIEGLAALEDLDGRLYAELAAEAGSARPHHPHEEEPS